jgi:hypothetical protein
MYKANPLEWLERNCMWQLVDVSHSSMRMIGSAGYMRRSAISLDCRRAG